MKKTREKVADVVKEEMRAVDVGEEDAEDRLTFKLNSFHDQSL